MGSFAAFETAGQGGRPPGKIDASLNEKLQGVKWGEYKLSDLFDIESTLSFNAERLVAGNEYDYVTRTSLNQGILQTTGFVNTENINAAGCWSLGLLQMDFFYRRKPWYAGQFVRKIIPKIKITEDSIPFLTTILNRQKKTLLSVLVRNVDKTFREIMVNLPTKNGKIDFEFMESFIRELEEERIRELTAYLTVSGFDNYELSNFERKALEEYSTLPFEDYPIVDIFDVKNTANILSNDITENSGTTPYLCASAENNAVSSYITYDEKYLEKGNCIFIGGKTFVVSYQEKDFYSNDSHNLALYLKNEDRTRLNQLYLATCIYRSLCHKYSWGNSVSKAKIKSDYVSLPTKDGKPDYSAMATFISAIQKLVIKDVVLYADRKIDGTKKIVANDDCQDNLRK